MATMKKTAAKKVAPRKTMAKKAAPKATAQKKAVAKKVAAKKPVAAKPAVTKGSKVSCQVCGFAYTVDRACGCIEEAHLVCCETPMKLKPAAKKK